MKDTLRISEEVKKTFKLSDYGLPPEPQPVLLMTETELLVITDILKDIAQQVHHRPQADILKKIDELEKPFRKNLNRKESK